MIVLQFSPWFYVRPTSRIEAVDASALTRLIFSDLTTDDRLSGEFRLR